jgi:ABC-type lipoprotein release transport system permease subunit
MMWTSFFRDGGFGMYPTSLFGFLLVASGILLVLRPERRYVSLVIALGLVTLGSGVLSSVVGIVNTFRYVAKVAAAEQVRIAVLGCAESMNNVVLALILGVLTALLASIAALRASRVKAAAV